MKILFLAPQPFFENRGTPINVRLILRALTGCGHEVELLTYPHGEDVDLPNLEIRRIAKVPFVGKAPIGPSWQKIVYDFFMAWHALWLVVTRKYDVIHAVEEASFIAMVLRSVTGVPYIFDMDSFMTDQLRYSAFAKAGPFLRLVQWLEKRSLSRAAVVITVCHYLTEVAMRYTSASKIFQIEDIPLDLPKPPEGVTADRLRRDYDIAPDAPVCLYTGNLEKYQGIELLVASAPHVVAATPETIFLIVGGDDASIAHYQQMATEMGVADAMVFTGPQPMAYMAPFQEMCDILLSPRLEGTNTPLKVYTYLEAGKPLVATNLPTHTQALNSDIAQLCEPNPIAFAEAIVLLLEDTEAAVALGERARNHVRKKYNYALFSEKIEKAYRAL